MAEFLVNEKDFELYRPFPPSVRWGTVENAILRAQRGYVRDALGKALYRDLHSNQAEAKYAKMLTDSGTTYNDSGGNAIDFYGIKPAICLYTYAVYLNDNQIRLTKSGNKTKDAQNSNNASAEEVMQEYARAMNEAEGYMQEVIDYLQSETAVSDGITLFNSYYRPRGGLRIGVGIQGDYYSEDNNRFDRGRYPYNPHKQ